MAQDPDEVRRRNRDNMRKRRAEDPQKYRDDAKARREADPERAREIQARYRARNADRLRARRQERTEAQREYSQAFYSDPARRAQKNDRGRRYYLANREAVIDRTRRYRLATRHGTDPEQIALMWEAQGGRCYLCGGPMPPHGQGTDLDHDHRCCPGGESCAYCRRGLACHPCNAIVGLAGDDAERLVRIAANLRIAMSAVTERLAGKPVQDQLFAEGGEAS